MKKYFLILILLFFVFIPLDLHAARGCCSWHGGVAGCHSSGKQLCNDGTLSPSCTCTPVVKNIYGCTDSDAKNYNSKANKDDGSCKYYVYGCTDVLAKNYNVRAEKDDGSCEYYVYGCMDEDAKNYDANAEKDNGSCEYYIYGCMDEDAKNYDMNAEKDNGNCQYDNIEISEEDSVIITIFAIMHFIIIASGGIYLLIYNIKKDKNTTRNVVTIKGKFPKIKI